MLGPLDNLSPTCLDIGSDDLSEARDKEVGKGAGKAAACSKSKSLVDL